MRIRRTIIIPALLTMSTAGSVLAGTAMSSVATSAPSAVVASASSMHPSFVYEG